MGGFGRSRGTIRKYKGTLLVGVFTLVLGLTPITPAPGANAAPSTTAAPTAASADETAPAAPALNSAVSSDGTITLSYTANTEPDLDGYLVYRSATSGGTSSSLTPTPIQTTSFVDRTVVVGNEYFYTISAVDLSGNESAPSNELSATAVDTTPPAKPVGVTATAGINSVRLAWTANTEIDLQDYQVYRSPTPTVPVDPAHRIGVVLKTAGQTYLDPDLTPATTYYYVITARDAVGNESTSSNVVSAIPTSAPDTTAPDAPTALTATTSGVSIVLTWTASLAADRAGYSVYRSTTATGQPVKLTTTLQTATTYTDPTPPAGATYYYEVSAVDTANNESAFSNQASATIAATPSVDVKINFQTSAAAVPAGYAKDVGSPYSTTAVFGWVRQDSLGQAVATPLDLTANVRKRSRAGIDPRLDTLIQMQYGDIVPTPTANGSLTPGAWEYGLANGRYTVTVSVGDQSSTGKTGCAAPCYDSVHTIRAEGVTVINRFQGTSAAEYKSGTATVDVADGKLTIDAIGGTNTKLNYITIVTAGPPVTDTTPPGAPTSVTGVAGDGAATLSWGAPADADVAGYNVYRSATSTVAVTAANKVNPVLVSAPNFTNTGLTNGTAYYYVVTAVDQSDNVSPPSSVVAVTPVAPTPTNFSVKVNFQDAVTTPPAGYLADWGQSYSARSSAGQGVGQSYGWVVPGGSTPLSLIGNGRNRNTGSPPANQPDLRLATFLHMQLPAATAGVRAPGSWELAVPNGPYTVTVAVGDAGATVDSTNWINIENQNAIAAFVPTTATKFATATRTVTVADGRLTISAVGGTNTKIDYVDVAGFALAGRPYTTAVTPGNGATEVVTNSSVTADNSLNAQAGAVDVNTLGGGNVTLTRVFDGVAVSGQGVTSGGGDTISFQANVALAAATLYRFEIKAGAKDVSGRSFLPFSSVFTTTSGTTPPPTVNAAFDKKVSGASTGKSYTSLVMGPDGKLYAGSLTGQIYRWTVGADGTLSGEQVITTVRDHASAQGWEGAPNRTVIGLTFDPASTASNLILWITDNYAYLGSTVPDVTGSIARLSGANLQNYQEVVVNLPRSIKDHETNSIAFHNGLMYVTQGSMNAMGAVDGTWQRAEHLLSGAVLRLDPSKLPATLPLDVATPDMVAPARGGVPAHTGTYNPYAAGAALTLYATGVRNAFDLVWHSNGHLYAGTNGSAAGGATPASPTPLPASCANRPEGSYTGPAVAAIANNLQAETDYIFDIKAGKYYGHPNPTRCEYVLNAGNPSGNTGNPLFKVNQYPVGQLADPNYDLPDVYDAGLHASADGSIEYKNTTAFGGALTGKLIVVRYSANQEIVAFSVAANGSVSAAVTGITGFTGFHQPLDLAEDTTTGNLYVSELTDNPTTTDIVLLKPQGGAGSVATAQATDRAVFTDIRGGAASAAKDVVVKNVGGAPLIITSATFTGADAALFARSGGPSLPVTVAPSATVAFPVTFAATVAGPRGAAIQFATNDPAHPTTATTLRGLGINGVDDLSEPSLQWILDTLQIPVIAGDPDRTNNDMPASSAMLGEEIPSQSFTKAAADHIVDVQAVAMFATNGPADNAVTAGVHTSGQPSVKTPLLRGPNASNDTLFPTMAALGDYDLATPFGFDFTWHGLADRVSYGEDALNTWDAANQHKVRVYQLKNTDGTIVPNSYVVAAEAATTPVDFQDLVLIVGNIKPTGAVVASTPVARIDFQPAASTVASGYTADAGAAYTTTRGFGWVTPGTSTAKDMTALPRDRGGAGDARLRTFIHMQPAASLAPGGPGAWEYAVPNGTYRVTVAVGDPGYYDSTHRIQVEGVTALSGFVPTASNSSMTAIVTVSVSDGRLTVDATGGTNTKLQYVDIDRVGT